MATRYSQDIKTNIPALTLESVQSLYKWITYCVKSYNADATPNFEIRYQRGEISCTTDNYEEFIRNTYGLTIAISNFQISYYKVLDLSFRIDPFIDTRSMPYKQYIAIAIYSGNIESISTIVPLLKNVISKGHIPTSNAIKQLPEITINVGGDFTMAGSSIGNNNKTNNKGEIAIIEKDTEISPTKNSFWEGVLQQIVANWIWWLLGLIGILSISFWSITQ